MTAEESLSSHKGRFEAYANRYDRTDGRVALKILHTLSVVSIMKTLCERRRLPEHTRYLATLCALYHDIGRFEQLKRYGTFLDHESCDHAALGLSVLKEEGMLSDIAEKDRQKIFTAIANHNRYKIDPELTVSLEKDVRDALELCKLIRDADKCDIFRVFATEPMADVIGASEEEVAEQAISPDVYETFMARRCVDKSARKTYPDFWISFLAFFFDLNYPESAAIARDQGYYRRPFDRTEFRLPETRRQVREVLDVLELYLSDILCTGTVPASLSNFFREHKRMALAFSGGTDSAYLMYAAKKCEIDVRAYYVSTPFQPQFELNDAKRLSAALGVPMTVLPFNVLEREKIRENSLDRCYHCKNAIFGMILEAAGNDGYHELMDGTNASDDAGDRPGMRALRELRVFSPLRQCGVTKTQLREYSKKAALFTWNKPAYACLATRIPTGTEIRKEMLDMAEWAEERLSNMGFFDFRVRLLASRSEEPDKELHFTDRSRYGARIQVTAGQILHVLERREEIVNALKERFCDVLLDLNTREPSDGL